MKDIISSHKLFGKLFSESQISRLKCGLGLLHTLLLIAWVMCYGWPHFSERRGLYSGTKLMAKIFTGMLHSLPSPCLYLFIFHIFFSVTVKESPQTEEEKQWERVCEVLSYKCLYGWSKPRLNRHEGLFFNQHMIIKRKYKDCSWIYYVIIFVSLFFIVIFLTLLLLSLIIHVYVCWRLGLWFYINFYIPLMPNGNNTILDY